MRIEGRRTHLQDLIESTSLIHYEGFRAKQVCRS